jgi:hypothetical protein
MFPRVNRIRVVGNLDARGVGRKQDAGKRFFAPRAAQKFAAGVGETTRL